MKRLFLAILLLTIPIPIMAQTQVIVTGGVATIDASLCGANASGSSCAFKVILTANTTVSIVNARGGQTLGIFFLENATGGWTVTWPSYVSSPPTISPGANTPTLVNLQYDGSGGTWSISGGGGGSLVAPNQQTWYISPNCSGQSNCTAIHDDAVILQDCTTTNTSSTVTCPDAIFTASDVGKTAWATSLGTSSQLQINATIACPITTILSVNSSTSVTLTAANDCTATLSGNAAFFFGTKDGATIATAMAANAGNFIFPSGSSRGPNYATRILIDQPFGNTLAASASGYPYITMTGSTPTTSSVIFVITPDFNWAGCTGNNGTLTNVCFGAKAINMNWMSFAGYGLNGTGACPAAAQAKTVVAPATLVSQNYGLNLNGICPGTLNLVGYEMDAFDSTVTWGGALHVGTMSCAIGGIGISGFYNSCVNDGATVSGNACASSTVGQCTGLWIKAAGQYQDFGSVWLENVINQGNFQSHSSHFYGSAAATAIITGTNAVHYSDGDFINETASPAGTTSFGVNMDFGGKMYAHNTLIRAGSSGTAVQLSNDGAVTTFFDQCGNTFAGGTILNNVGNAGNVSGTCSASVAAPAGTNNGWLTSGWGTSTLTGTVGDSHRMRFLITVSGVPGANPVLTPVFPTPYPLVAPASCTITEVSGTFGILTNPSVGVPTKTSVAITFIGTPVATNTYTFDLECGP